MAHKRTINTDSAVWTVYFDDANEPYHVQRLESVWSTESGAANQMMTERIRRIIELAKQTDNTKREDHTDD